MKNHWHLRYLQLAAQVATWSKDRSTKVGAVLYNVETHATLLTSFNGLARGMDDKKDEYHARPAKYFYAEHAERNLIYFAARHGVRTEGLGIASSLYPCADCARAIVQAGLTELVVVEPDWNDPRWGESFKVSRTILQAGGVTVHMTSIETGLLIEIDPEKYPARPRVGGIPPQ
jgi:dCMP deaminase